jgi:peptidoglycan/LPS O-acetylase OafA/YrhL
MGIQVAMEQAPNEPRHLGRRPVLDGVRGIAIVLVMLSHTGILPNGYVGVDLFFALSGFLITSILYEEWDRSGTISLRKFYGRRARRLLPALGVLLLVALIVDVACYPMTGWSLGKKALLSSVFVNNWVAAAGHANELGSLNPTWSLGQEEQFYLVWPLLLIVLLRLRVRPVLVALLLFEAILLLYHNAPKTGLAHAYQVYYSPEARSAELLAGCLGAVVWRHRLLRVPVRLMRLLPASVRELSGRKHIWRALLAVVLIYLFKQLLFSQTLLLDQVYTRACLLAVPLIVLLIGAPKSLVARLIGCAPLRYLGKISYALYLFHLLIRNVVYHYLPNASLDLTAAVTFAASLTLAALSWRLIEAPMLARGRRGRRDRSPVRRRFATFPSIGYQAKPPLA